MSDHDLVLVRLRGVLGEEADPHRISVFTCFGEPTSQYRPKNGDARLLRTFTMFPHTPFTGSVCVVAIFFRPNYLRMDSDNMMKLVLDVGTKAKLWVDDSQVTAHGSYIELDAERPRTVVAISPFETSIGERTPLTLTCERCARTFTVPGWARKRETRFCSRRCARAAERVAAKCPKCDREFFRRTSGQRYCSQPCANSAPRVRQPNALQRPPAACQVCGGKVSRREYLRCANCAPKGRRLGTKNKAKPTQES